MAYPALGRCQVSCAPSAPIIALILMSYAVFNPSGKASPNPMGPKMIVDDDRVGGLPSAVERGGCVGGE